MTILTISNDLREYYVDATSGNDDNDGMSAPWQTIAKVNASMFLPGDKILFKRGETWRETLTVPSSGAVGSPITFGAYGSGSLPKIYGSTQISTWTDEGGNLWYADCATDPVSVWFVNTDTTIIWGSEQTAKVDLNAEYEWWWDDPNNRLYVYAASDPDSRYTSVEIPTRSRCIYSNGKNYITASNLEAPFCLYTGGTDARGIFIANSTNAIVEYCVSHHHGDLGNGTDPQGNGIFILNGVNVIVRNNTCYENGRRGICLFADTGGSVNNAIVEYNESYNNYHAQCDFFVGGGGANTMDSATIRYNLAYLNDDYGAHGKGVLGTHGIYLQTDGGTNYLTNPVIHHNTVYEMYNDSLIALTTRVTGAEIYNNTVYGAFAGSTFSPGIDIRNANSNGATVKNNIGMNCVGGCLRIANSSSIDTLNYNCWYQSGGGTNVYARVGATDYHFDDFAAYKAATGWDTNGLWENPLFTDAPNNDFTLQAGSPCQNAGDDGNDMGAE